MSEKTFEFEHKGKKYEIPNFADLPMGALRKGRKGSDDADKAFILLEETLGEDSEVLAVVDTMKKHEFLNFVNAWTQGAGVGEALDS